MNTIKRQGCSVERKNMRPVPRVSEEWCTIKKNNVREKDTNKDKLIDGLYLNSR